MPLAVHSRLLYCLFCLLGIISTTNAQMLADGSDDLAILYSDDELISIATGTYKPIRLAPSVASFITADDIKAMGARNIFEALEFVPGIHISNSSLARMEPTHSIRGIHTVLDNQVLLLINGYRIGDPYLGARPPLYQLGVNNISRIEIVRGPGSAVYGADALSGVINIITKESDEIDGTEVGVRSGSFNSKDMWLLHSDNYLGWETALSFEYHSTDGDRGRIIDSDLQTIFDRNSPFNTSASLAPGPANTQYNQQDIMLTLSKDQWKLWMYRYHLWDAGQGAGATQMVDPVGRQLNKLQRMALEFKDSEFTEHLGLDAKLEYRRGFGFALFQLFPPGATLMMANDGNIYNPLNKSGPAGWVRFTEGVRGNPGSNYDNVDLETVFTYDGFDKHRLRFALGGLYFKVTPLNTKNFGPGVLDTSGLSTDINDPPVEIDATLTDTTGTPYIFMQEQSRHVSYLSLQDEWSFAADWELTAGLRLDHYSDFGNTVNPRMALVWAADYNLTSKLLYGRAFRAPGFNELYFINNPSTRGNPDLKPEIIDVVELVFDYKPNFDIHSITNLYRYDLDDLIEHVEGVAHNERDQDGYGMETELHWQASDKISLIASYTWQRSQDSNSGYLIPRAPIRQATLAMRYKVNPQCYANPQVNWVADRKRALGDTRPPVSDYTRTDITLRCSVQNIPLEIAASVRNAFDEDIREPSINSANIGAPMPNDVPLEGRAAYLELVYRFSK